MIPSEPTVPPASFQYICTSPTPVSPHVRTSEQEAAKPATRLASHLGAAAASATRRSVPLRTEVDQMTPEVEP